VVKLIRWLLRVRPSVKQALVDKIHELVSDRVISDPHLAAKFYPYQPDKRSYLLRAAEEQTGDPGLPVPPRELWWGYGQSPQEYLEIGQGHVAAMRSVLQAAGGSLEPGNRILDFGCGSGIMLRWLNDLAQVGEVWGVDISERHMYWCQQHLSPPFLFATTTSFPHLPFEDCYFDFVYAGSVFTHIADLAETWLLELKRVTRPGGKLYLTVHDEHTIDLITSESSPWQEFREMLRAADKEIQCLASGFSLFTINRTPGAGGAGDAQVFYHTSYLRKHWGRFLKVLSVTPEAYGYQTAILLQK
jgi:SAM-dependent methyltransferase